MNFSIEEPSIECYDNSYILIHNNRGYCYDENRKFITNSNDACYLFNGQCFPPKIGEIGNFINIKVIPFLTNFHTGVHAYSGIYSMLKEYLKNSKEYEDYKIVVYENVQSGILEILYTFFDNSKILLLQENVLYRFSQIKIIQNSLHSFLERHDLSIEISNLIINNIKNENNVFYPKKIALIKTIDNSITSVMGAIDVNIAKNYCEKNNYELINPLELGEVMLANYINNCEEILFSWGTTFMKNFIYLSDKCVNAKVLIFGVPFKMEYENAISRDIIVKKYKNCVFEYLIEPKL